MSWSVFENTRRRHWRPCELPMVVLFVGLLFVVGFGVCLHCLSRTVWFPLSSTEPFILMLGAGLMVGVFPPLVALTLTHRAYPARHMIHRWVMGSLAWLIAMLLSTCLIASEIHDWPYGVWVYRARTSDGGPLPSNHPGHWYQWIATPGVWLSFTALLWPFTLAVCWVVARATKGAAFYVTVSLMLLAGGLLVVGYTTRQSWDYYPNVAEIGWVCVMWSMCCATMLATRRSSQVVRRKSYSVRCVRCQYDLRGSVLGGRDICPECGGPVCTDQAAWIKANHPEEAASHVVGA